MSLKKYVTVISSLFYLLTLPLHLHCQSDTLAPFVVSHEQEMQAQQWIDNLYEMGIRIEGDTVFVSEETRKIAADTAYRAMIYRTPYSWAEANNLFDKKQFKIAFWYLLNIYQDNPSGREKVIKYVLSFDHLFQMDKVMTSVFYTYAFLDPQVAIIIDGKPDVRHPEIIEEKQAVLREIVQYIWAYRERKENKNLDLKADSLK